MSTASRDSSKSNIFKSMKDITFEQTISHQCVVRSDIGDLLVLKDNAPLLDEHRRLHHLGHASPP